MHKRPRAKLAKALVQGTTTLRRLNLWLCAVLLVAGTTSVFAEDATHVFPGFRHVDATAATAGPVRNDTIILLVDADFAPWSFEGADGTVQGLSVDLAREACRASGLTCEIRAKAFPALLEGLRSGAAQGIASGLKLDKNLAREFALTRPYFRSLGRFATRSGSSLAGPDIRSLAGRRLGFRDDTSHARFIKTYYSRSALTPFKQDAEMLEALRTGQIDVAFGDAVQMSYWLGGTASKGCCNFLGKSFVHTETFSRSLSFILHRNDPNLRARLDRGLDQIEANGMTAKIFSRYLPASIW